LSWPGLYSALVSTSYRNGTSTARGVAARDDDDDDDDDEGNAVAPDWKKEKDSDEIWHGSMVGLPVGSDVGYAVGCAVGLEVGSRVGGRVGRLVGFVLPV